MGELEGGGNRRTVQLDVTVKELYGNESPYPVNSAISEIKLSPSAGNIPDGNYTLRYSYGGKQEQTAVRIKVGVLLAGN
jgi:hypothetical protein